MILLDTNVVSELMRQTPAESVLEWVAAQNPVRLSVSTITIAEIEFGLALLPKGRRRQRLESSFEAFVMEGFGGRILSFDEKAAHAYGQVAAKRKSEGSNVEPVDLMIAAIAKVHHAAIATRNIRDFEGCELQVINPWTG